MLLARAVLGELADDGAALRARVVRIDVFAPPYVRSTGGWVRRGTGTLNLEVALESHALW